MASGNDFPYLLCQWYIFNKLGDESRFDKSIIDVDPDISVLKPWSTLVGGGGMAPSLLDLLLVT